MQAGSFAARSYSMSNYRRLFVGRRHVESAKQLVAQLLEDDGAFLGKGNMLPQKGAYCQRCGSRRHKTVDCPQSGIPL